MDVLLIAAAGVLAPLLVFALWRLIPSDQHVTWSPALGRPIRTWQKDGGEIRGTGRPGRTHRNAAEPPYSRRAGQTSAYWAGRGTVQDATPRSSIRRLAVSGAPRAVRQSKSKSRSGTKVRSEPQWPPARSVNGYIVQLPAGLSSMRRFSIGEQHTAKPAGGGSRAMRRLSPRSRARRSQTERTSHRKGGPLTQPKVASFGKELAALAAFARDGWCVSAPGPAETAFQLRKRGADCTKSTGHDGTRLQNRHLPRGQTRGVRGVPRPQGVDGGESHLRKGLWAHEGCSRIHRYLDAAGHAGRPDGHCDPLDQQDRRRQERRARSASAAQRSRRPRAASATSSSTTGSRVRSRSRSTEPVLRHGPAGPRDHVLPHRGRTDERRSLHVVARYRLGRQFDGTLQPQQRQAVRLQPHLHLLRRSSLENRTEMPPVNSRGHLAAPIRLRRRPQ